ncbi:hypothetical protein BKA69DRAFT_1127401 [Paraphysoderma sedebokerense]|nr:hypothetical protein BKA69DRAFT_1127401 [Paraphysoderma sedebokerense]
MASPPTPPSYGQLAMSIPSIDNDNESSPPPRLCRQRPFLLKLWRLLKPEKIVKHAITEPAVKPLTELINHIPIKSKKIVFLVWHIIAIFVLCLLIYFSLYASGRNVQRIPCYASLWSNNCGVGGWGCAPFANVTTQVKCPAGCATQRSWSSRFFVGEQNLYLQNGVIGNGIYRGDSYICQAAIHQGLISDSFGGCVQVETVGSHSNFSSTESNGILSTSFPSSFPKSFRLSTASNVNSCSSVYVPSTVTMVILLTIFIFLRPSKRHYFFTISTYLYFFWIFLGFDTPTFSNSYLSSALGNFILFTAVNTIVYSKIVKYSLPSMSFIFDILLFHFGAIVLGIFIEVISTTLPPITFTYAMFRHTSSIVLFIIILGIILACLIHQVYFIRSEGRLPKYVASYTTFISLYFILPNLIDLSIHIHHWTFGLFLLPGTKLQKRMSLLIQGVLFGLYLQGVARWGFDSPFSTTLKIQSDQGLTFGSAVPKWNISFAGAASNNTNGNSSVIVSWNYESATGKNISDITMDLLMNQNVSISGYSLMMNDVEVYRGVKGAFILNLNQTAASNLSAGGQVGQENIPFQIDKSLPYYFRVAAMEGGSVLDYSDIAKVWAGNGSIEYFARFTN